MSANDKDPKKIILSQQGNKPPQNVREKEKEKEKEASNPKEKLKFGRDLDDEEVVVMDDTSLPEQNSHELSLSQQKAPTREDWIKAFEQHNAWKRRYQKLKALEAFLNSPEGKAVLSEELIPYLREVQNAIAEESSTPELIKEKCLELMKQAEAEADKAQKKCKAIAERRKQLNVERRESKKVHHESRLENQRDISEEQKVIVEGDSESQEKLVTRKLVTRKLSRMEMRGRFLQSSGAKISDKDVYIPISESGEWIPTKDIQERKRKNIKSCREKAYSDWKRASGNIGYGSYVAPKSDENELDRLTAEIDIIGRTIMLSGVPRQVITDAQAEIEKLNAALEPIRNRVNEKAERDEEELNKQLEQYTLKKVRIFPKKGEINTIYYCESTCAYKVWVQDGDDRQIKELSGIANPNSKGDKDIKGAVLVDIDKQKNIAEWSSRVQDELGLTTVQVDGLVLTLNQQLYTFHQNLCGKADPTAPPIDYRVVISRPDKKKDTIEIQLSSSIVGKPPLESRFVININELTNNGQPKMASVWELETYEPQTFDEAAKEVEIPVCRGSMEKWEQLEVFMEGSMLQITNRENPADPIQDLDRTLNCNGRRERDLFFNGDAAKKKEICDEALNDLFPEVSTKAIPAADVLRSFYDQGIADLGSHFGSKPFVARKIKRVTQMVAQKRSGNLFSGGPSVFNVTGVASGWELTYQKNDDLICDDFGVRNIPGEIFVTATKTVNGGVGRSTCYSNLLLKSLFEYAPIRKDNGEVVYPELRVYGHIVVNEGGTINEDGLERAVEEAQKEEDFAQYNLDLARNCFDAYRQNEYSSELDRIRQLVENHLISKEIAKYDHCMATLSTAMATAIYRDLPLVLSDKKKLEHCPLLLKTIAWCGVPELNGAMCKVLGDQVGEEKLNDLLAMYGLGDDTADFAELYREIEAYQKTPAYQAEDESHKKAIEAGRKDAGKRWVKAAAANLAALRAEEAEAASRRPQLDMGALSHKIRGEIEANIAALDEQEKTERAALTAEVDAVREDIADAKGRRVSVGSVHHLLEYGNIPEALMLPAALGGLEIDEAVAAGPLNGTAKNMDEARKQKSAQVLQEIKTKIQEQEKRKAELKKQLQELAPKFTRLRKAQQDRNPRAEAKAAIEQSRLEAELAQKRIVAAEKAAGIAAAEMLQTFYLQRPGRVSVKLAIDSCTFLPRNKAGSFKVVTLCSGLWVGEDFVPGEILLTTSTDSTSEIGIQPAINVRASELLKGLLEYTYVRRHVRHGDYNPFKVGNYIIIDEDGKINRDALKAAANEAQKKEDTAWDECDRNRGDFEKFVSRCEPYKSLQYFDPRVITYQELFEIQDLLDEYHEKILDTATVNILYRDLPGVFSKKSHINDKSCVQLYHAIKRLEPELRVKILKRIWKVDPNLEKDEKFTKLYADCLLRTEDGRMFDDTVQSIRKATRTALIEKTISSTVSRDVSHKVNLELIHCVHHCTNPDPNRGEYQPKTTPEHLAAVREQYAHGTSSGKRLAWKILVGVGCIVGVGILVGLGIVTAGIAPAAIAAGAAAIGTLMSPTIAASALGALAGSSLLSGAALRWSRKKDVKQVRTYMDGVCTEMGSLINSANEPSVPVPPVAVPEEEEREEVGLHEGCGSSLSVRPGRRYNENDVFIEVEEGDPNEDSDVEDVKDNKKLTVPVMSPEAIRRVLTDSFGDSKSSNEPVAKRSESESSMLPRRNGDLPPKRPRSLSTGNVVENPALEEGGKTPPLAYAPRQDVAGNILLPRPTSLKRRSSLPNTSGSTASSSEQPGVSTNRNSFLSPPVNQSTKVKAPSTPDSASEIGSNKSGKVDSSFPVPNVFRSMT